MKISNEQIIASARRQRQKVLNTIDHLPLNIDHWAPPETVPSKNNGQRSMVNGQWWIAAASLVSFFAGYALHAYMPEQAPQPVAQTVEVRHDTIMQVQTVRDTIYETRVVTKYEPMLAKAEASPSPEQEEADTPPEQKACSMLCDDIPYELLAQGR